jgi:hypothetical protein
MPRRSARRSRALAYSVAILASGSTRWARAGAGRVRRGTGPKLPKCARRSPSASCGPGTQALSIAQGAARSGNTALCKLERLFLNRCYRKSSWLIATCFANDFTERALRGSGTTPRDSRGRLVDGNLV